MDPNLPTVPTPTPQVESSPQPPTVTQPTQPVIPPLSKSKFPVFLIVFLFIILLGIGGFFGYQKYFGSKTPPETTPIITVAPSPTPDPTADWEVYTSPIHHVTFKYPPPWILDVITDPNWPNGENTKVILKKEDAVIQMYLNLVGIGGQGRSYKGEPFVLDKHDLYLYSETSSKSTYLLGLTDSLENSIGVFKVNDKTYDISLRYPSGYNNQNKGKDLQKEFSQILSTFQFTE